jgi:hypothetical protein
MCLAPSLKEPRRTGFSADLDRNGEQELRPSWNADRRGLPAQRGTEAKKAPAKARIVAKILRGVAFSCRKIAARMKTKTVVI